MGSGTHGSKIHGFPGTHETHANGATVYQGALVEERESHWFDDISVRVREKTIHIS